MRTFHRLALIPVLFAAGCGDEAVTAPGPDPIVGIEVIARSDVMVAGRSMQLDVEAITASGKSLPVSEAAWTTTDPDVADVTAAGVVTGVAEGEAVITAAAEDHEARLTVRVAADSLPLFTAAPFEGTYNLSNPFDHDLPIWSGNRGQILTWRGFNVSGLEGHNGYDWPMPEGTPLYAVGDGVVGFAGGETPWSCPLLGGESVSALFAVIVHTAPSRERYLSIYIHLSHLDVQSGDTVVAGQPIGLSGNTGCSTGPHLHFEVRREFYHRTPYSRQTVVTDPNGWAGAQDDPWLLDRAGAASTHLWAPGATPSFPLPAMESAPPSLATLPDPPIHLHRFSVPPLPTRAEPPASAPPGSIH